ncbi:hypothetical protein GGI25_004050 [Coemansia spiralis]|uniref:Serine carboxypeptidase S28-domain-containing protein n=2 Tax=Coemansia TaxID=4863 RepID=A0A9W8G105_9FUNG|nr:hypothetical protein EDC05_003309 [Coemansia umbellata]KAJ2620864.1 hypothetical protein GGI26_004659 [Coemansia sp. RSA 1358]KAJ2675210.1 hypothetical protein GGI25_004050 [Coemansia spiralis]
MPGGPIFVTTAGESALTSYNIDGTYITELAQSTSGMIIAIEHRFYGQSSPMPDLSGASLQYLTIDNVLEDFASIIRAIKANTANSTTTLPFLVNASSPIIFAGGSYAGSVAAWMRAKYPELVIGAWASSATLYGRLENYQFDQAFGRHLKAVGCAQCFAQAIADLDTILNSDDANKIGAVQTKLGIPLLGSSDLSNLLTVFATIGAMQPVTLVSDPVYSTVCSFFNQTTTSQIGYSTCLNSYIAMINELISESQLTPEMLIALGNSSLAIDYTALNQPQRVWYYQMCSWFGMWQVAPPPKAVSGLTSYRSQLLDLDYFQSNCPKKFGSQSKSPVDVGAYNEEWFDILKNTTNVYYTSGSLDVWRDSTVATSTGNLFEPVGDSLIIVIDGATHVQDLTASSELDLPSVKEARLLGYELVNKWIRNSGNNNAQHAHKYKHKHKYSC